MTERPAGRHTGLRGTADEVLERVRALGDVLGRTAGSAIGAGTAVPVVGDLLTSMARLVEQAPAPTVQLDIFLQEIAAKRALINAFQAQLRALDSQMEVLEKSLQPVAEWGRQWARVQDGLNDGLRVLFPEGRPEPGPDAPGPDAPGRGSAR